MQQALEALEWHYRQGHSNTLGGLRLKIDEKALRALRAALAAMPKEEPVAWIAADALPQLAPPKLILHGVTLMTYRPEGDFEPLYAHPAPVEPSAERSKR
jgi:hypothetical protein